MSSKPQKKVFIEVAVRARPLNNFESRDGEDNAWEIKTRQFGQKSKDQGDKVIQLKNKFRFVFQRQEQPERRITRTTSQVNVKVKSKSRNQWRSTRSISQSYNPYDNNTLGNVWNLNSNRKDAMSSQVSNFKNQNNFKQLATPVLFTPRPIGNPQLTPEINAKISEFKIENVASVPINQNKTTYSKKTSKQRMLMNRSKSLTAISKSKSVTRLPQMQDFKSRFSACTPSQPERSKSPFVQGWKPVTKVRAKSHFGGRQEAEFEGNVNVNLHKEHKFQFDTVFNDSDTNFDVYKQTVRKVAISALQGVNGTVFVYGNTGTGKTYTMMGQQRTKNQSNYPHGSNVEYQALDISGQILSDRAKKQFELKENSGVLIYAMQDLFQQINLVQASTRGTEEEVQFQIKLSYIEIYNEVVYDLLVVKKQDVDQSLFCHEAKNNKEFHVSGANQIQVESIDQALDLISIGERNKHYAETFLNHCSSRSHTMFRLTIIQYRKQGNGYLQTKSYLNFVDLAGSERISNYFGNPKNNGPSEIYQQFRLKEGLSINKSLFNLTQVIHMLSQNPNQHIPYRNSTLTKLLRSSLGGNSKTSIIICITPANSQIEQTISCLKFGEKAMMVQNSAEVQVKQIKLKALKNRLNFGLGSKAGIDHKIVQEIINEYESKIQSLEQMVTDHAEISKLNQQVKELTNERDRLQFALEMAGNRSFFIKQLINTQRKGHQVLNLQIAGDVAIQSSKMARLSIEQMLEERDNIVDQANTQMQTHKRLVEGLVTDLKYYKAQNKELKEECDKLEIAYHDIIQEFGKMNQMQTDLIKLQNTDNLQMELQRIEQLNDREIQRIDSEYRKSLLKIKEEKEKRSKLKKTQDTLSMGSTGHLKNYIRPYNPKITGTQRILTSPGAFSQSQRSFGSSPHNCLHSRELSEVNKAYKDFNEVYNQYQMNHSQDNIKEEENLPVNHFQSKQGKTEDQIMGRQALNSTFGVKKVKRLTNVSTQKKHEIANVPVDKSIYNQKNEPVQKNGRASSFGDQNRTMNQVDLQNQALVSNRDSLKQSVTEETEDCENFIPIKNFNQYLMKQQAQFDPIKEDTQNENVTNSFDNISNSHGFDISAPHLPGRTPSAFSGISGVQHVKGCNESTNSSIKNVNNMMQQQLYNYKDSVDANTPQRHSLHVQPEEMRHRQSEIEYPNPNTTFEHTNMSRLSGISQNQQARSLYEQEIEVNKVELMYEFQIDQFMQQNQRHEYLCKQQHKSNGSPVFYGTKNSNISKEQLIVQIEPERNPKDRPIQKEYISFQQENPESITLRQRSISNTKQQEYHAAIMKHQKASSLQIIEQVISTDNLRAQIKQQQQQQYHSLHSEPVMELQQYDKSFSNNMSSSGASGSNAPKSKKTRNLSIDLSSTNKQERVGNIEDIDKYGNFEIGQVDVNYTHLRPSQLCQPLQHGCEYYSDNQTPYGMLNETDEQYRQLLGHHGLDQEQENLINLKIKTNQTTPQNVQEQDENQVYFKNYKTGQTLFEDHLQFQSFKEGTRSQQNFIQDDSLIKENYHQQLQPMILFQKSAFEEESISLNSKSVSQPLDKSKQSSFQPQLKKEIKKIEKSNKKLKKQEEQYQKMFEQIKLLNSRDPNCENEIRSTQSKKSSKKSAKTQKAQEQVINISTVSQNVQLKSKKSKKSRDGSNSIFSHSTTQGQTVISAGDINHRSSRILQAINNHDNCSSLISNEFDVKSKCTASSKKNMSSLSKKKSQKQITPKESGKADETMSPPALQMLNQKLSTIDNDWQSKSQASLDKMQQLQKAYEQIKQRRKDIINQINLEDNVLLRNEKPKVKNFEPVRKSSPNNVKYTDHHRKSSNNKNISNDWYN